MAMRIASEISGDRDLVCPYDPTHKILAKGMTSHLIKCRRNHKGHKLEICPFDNTHRHPKPEMQYHKSICDKRYLLDRDLQSRAGDNGLKGDVVGPPIVADHTQGQDRGGEENWDELPEADIHTPALFNSKVQSNSPHQPSTEQFFTSPGSYVPHQREEPVIRKVPNAPAKAATLTNPTSAPLRAPGPNSVFNFSLGLTEGGRGLGLMRMPRAGMNGPVNAAVRPGFSSGVRMTGVRAPGADQGPRFIGRGVSKLATKGNPTLPTMTSSAQASKAVDSVPKPPGLYEQFEDKTSSNTSHSNSVDAIKRQQEEGLNLRQSHSKTKTAGQEPDVMTDEELALKHQQFALQQDMLQHQNQQLAQLKEQHCEQQKELNKKHQLQMLQLQKLQMGERQKLLLEQNRREQELVSRAQILSLSLMDSSAASGVEGPPQSFIPAAMMEALRLSGGESSSQFMPPNVQNPSSTSGAGPIQADVQEDAEETWHENGGAIEGMGSLSASASRDAIPASSHHDDGASGSEGVSKERKKLQKMLKQLEILEQKYSLGHRLSADEEAELDHKSDLEARLKELNNL